ncbi:hypothetical protein V5N11_033664 [Cardamine amara subsp. amara]|uniref:RNase H type-1 domain-containing protein n=1 Tax=Cardamine amara subsp. amara TaxID=228776 RepID=A0ABD0ZAT3_CARAN
METINHLLFQCPYASLAWQSPKVDMFTNRALSSSLEENIQTMVLQLSANTSRNNQHFPFLIGWQLWKSRNDLIFNKVSHNVYSIITKEEENLVEWICATTSTHQPSPHLSPPLQQAYWQKQPPGYLKCNFDASYIHNNTHIGVGWVLRDEYGIYKLSGSSKLHQGSSPLEAEGMDLLHATQYLWCRGFRKVIIETDCRELHKLLHNQCKIASMESLIIDTRSWADRFANISFTLVPPECNQVADKLAKRAIIQSLASQIYFYPLSCISFFLFQDYINNAS